MLNLGEPAIELLSWNIAYHMSDLEMIEQKRHLQSRQTLQLTPLIFSIVLKYSSAQWEIMDVKTIIEEDSAHAQLTHMKRGDHTRTIIPPFNTEDLPLLVANFIGNTRVIDLTATILHTTDIRDVVIISPSIIPHPRELVCMKIVHEMVEIPLATCPARNY